MRAPRTTTLLIALACALPASLAHAEAKKAESLSAVESEKLLAFFDDLVGTTARQSAEADCKAQASELDAVVTRHQPTLQMLWAAKKANKVVPRDVQEKMDKRAKDMVLALRRCWDDPSVKAVFAKMKAPKEAEK